MKTHLVIYLSSLAGAVLFALQAPAKTVTIVASSMDQTTYFQSQVNSLVDGDSLVLAPGNHYIGAYIDIWFNSGSISGAGGAIVRKISGTTSGLTVHGSHTHIDQVEIDGGGSGTHGPCMAVLNGTGNNITNSKFHNSGDNTGLLLDHTSLAVVQGCLCYNNYVCGISQSACTDQQILDGQMYSNGAEGLTIDTGSHNCTVHNCWVHQNNTGPRGVGGIGIDGSNGANISACTIDYNGSNGITFQNNLNQVDDGCNIHDNPNISYNGNAAVGIFKSHLVTHLGYSNNTAVGNPGGNGVVIFSP